MSECMCDDYGNDLCTVHGGTQDQIIERAAARIAVLEAETARLTELIQHLESWKAPNGQFFDLTNPEAQVAPVLEENARLKEELQYATAPVDKGIPKRIYDVVCKERDAANDRIAALVEIANRPANHYSGCRIHLRDENPCTCGLKEEVTTAAAADQWRKRVEKEAVDRFLTEIFHQEIGDIADTDKFRESLLAIYRKFKPGDTYTWEVNLASAILYWEEEATKPLREALRVAFRESVEVKDRLERHDYESAFAILGLMHCALSAALVTERAAGEGGALCSG